jgi:hypothetical protein
MKIGEFLRLPFPSPIKNWKRDVLFLSIFVAVFLLIFQPLEFQIPYKQLILLGFGLTSYLTGSFLHLVGLNLFRKYFSKYHWNNKRQILWFSVQLFFIGLVNHFYTALFIPNYVNGIEGFVIFEFRAFSLGAFPLTVQLIVIYYYRTTKRKFNKVRISKNTKIEKVSDNFAVACFIADNEKDKIEIEIDNLLMVESVGNYIQIYHLQDNILKINTLRCSLKRAEDLLAEQPFIKKCHRAYIVNLKNVVQVKRISKNIKLIINQIDREIPVARNYLSQIMPLLNID